MDFKSKMSKFKLELAIWDTQELTSFFINFNVLNVKHKNNIVANRLANLSAKVHHGVQAIKGLWPWQVQEDINGNLLNLISNGKGGLHIKNWRAQNIGLIIL